MPRPLRARPRPPLVRSLLSLVALAAACGGDDAGPEVDDSALCAAYQAACARQAECGVPVFTTATDEDDCLAQLDCVGTAAALAAGDVMIATDEALACAEALSGATCAELEPWQGGRRIDVRQAYPSCVDMLVGTRAQGESCASAQQCQPGLSCVGDTCPGQCGPDTRSCDRTSCPTGQFCNLGGCAPRAALGEPCEYGDGFDNTCADGLFCRVDGGPQGVCVAPTARGGACTAASYYACADGDACIDGTCQAPRPIGGACSTATDCGLDHFCDFANGNRCAPARALGAACGTSWGECGYDANCVDDTCQPFGSEPAPGPIETRPTVALGADCAEANCPSGAACLPSAGSESVAWRCGAAPGPGESCDPGTDELRFAVLFSGRFGSLCRDSLCDLFAGWTCVVPAPPGAACPTDGTTLACTAGRCDGGTCAEFFTCP
jgi:hypothetical protein